MTNARGPRARARDAHGCELVLFPELTLCGYPPEDLLLHRGLRSRVEAAFARVREGVRGIAIYLGYPEYDGDAIYNSAALLRDGDVLANYRKVALPNYAVFDEKRYFQPGDSPTVVDLEDALSSETLLYEGAGSNAVFDSTVLGMPDVTDDFFADCEVVVSGRFLNQRVAPCPMCGRRSPIPMTGGR